MATPDSALSKVAALQTMVALNITQPAPNRALHPTQEMDTLTLEWGTAIIANAAETMATSVEHHQQRNRANETTEDYDYNGPSAGL